MNGYWGKLLIADLSKGELKDEPLNEQYARDFIGSTGLAARYLYDLVDGKTDPLGPDNPLIIMPGLLNGTSAPSVSRWGGATRSPHTGHYGDANAGAWFGAELKKAGYDGIILKGQSDKPVYLYIKDGVSELRDAAGLWGKDTVETQEQIKNTGRVKRLQIACIGPASERLVPYGNIMTEYGHALGRAGLGCVMGSKKVKAIAVRGTMKFPMKAGGPSPDRLIACCRSSILKGLLMQPAAPFLSTSFTHSLSPKPVIIITRVLLSFRLAASRILKPSFFLILRSVMTTSKHSLFSFSRAASLSVNAVTR